MVFHADPLEVLDGILPPVLQYLAALRAQRVAVTGEVAVLLPVREEATGDALAGLGEAALLRRSGERYGGAQYG